MSSLAAGHAPADERTGTAGPTEALASFVVSYPDDGFSDDVIERGEKHLMDTVACLVAGTHTEVGQQVMGYFMSGATGPRPIAGHRDRTAAATSALVNGTFAHALDYDDVIPMMPGHPSGVIVSALIAAAPAGATGLDFIRAYLVGLEAGVHVGAAVGIDHYKRGWHTTGTIAIFAAVAGIARLTKMTVAETRAAFGLASSMSSGIQANFGTMTKSFHAGWAAHNAVIATDLARRGFTVSPIGFEAVSGFFATYGTDRSDVNRITDGLADPWVILSPGLGVKKYPCCYALHRSIEALMDLRQQLPIGRDTVASIVSRAAPGGFKPLIYTRPTTGLEGKFSMDYTLAVGVLDGRFTFDAYSDAGVNREAIRQIYPLVSKEETTANLRPDPEDARRGPGTIGFHEVTVTLRDGRSASVRVDKPSGAPGSVLDWSALEAKFTDCSRFGGYSAEAAKRNLARWRSLRHEADMASVIESLTDTGAAG